MVTLYSETAHISSPLRQALCYTRQYRTTWKELSDLVLPHSVSTGMTLAYENVFL